MLPSPNLQSPLILTHVSKSSVMTSSRRPSPPSTHMCTCTHTHTHTHTSAHTHTYIPVWDRVLSLSSYSHNNVIFNKHLLPSLHSVFLEYKHYILFIWASPEPSTVPGREHAGNKCQMKPYMNKSIMILQRQLGGIWKGHIFIKNKPWGQCTSLKGQQLKFLVIFFCDKY